jgi:4-amino-4-deoxy-L-arabinose transferase-like glycosyltransferase
MRLVPRALTYFQLGLLVVLIAVLTTNRLNAGSVCGANEAIAGVFVEQMVEHGHWLFPLDDGTGPMYKPPLFHWTATALDRLAGIRKVDTFNLRFPAALYAIAGAVLTIGFALNRFGPTPAALSGLILAASYQYISQGRIGRVDMTLTFFEALSLFSFLWWLGAVEDGRSSRRVTILHFLLAASMGLGVLAKGPVGAILPGLAIGLFIVIEKRWTEFRRLMRPLPLIFGLALAMSWYAICLVGRQYSFLSRQIGSENFGRFFGSLGRMPFWYYAQPLLLNAGPISLLVPVAVITALAMLRTRGPDSNFGDNNSAPSEIDCARLFALFWLVTVVFFELAAYKRKAYLLPLWPPSAILLAWWTWRIARPRWGKKTIVALATVCVAMTMIDFFFIPWQETHECGVKLSADQTLEWPFLSMYGKEPSYVTRQDWLRNAARQMNGAMSTNEPLFAYRFAGALEPWIFYLHRKIVRAYGPINMLPSGYVLVRRPIWNDVAEGARGFTKLLTLPDDNSGLVLLHHDTSSLAEPVLMRSTPDPGRQN